RRSSGSYYTPAALVREVVRTALEATLVTRFGLSGRAAERWVYHGEAPPRSVWPSGLTRLTVLDPAVGSGAFLLGALEELTALRQAAGDGPRVAVRRDVLAHSLFGVDLKLTAVRLAELRLWLALVADDEEADLFGRRRGLDGAERTLLRRLRASRRALRTALRRLVSEGGAPFLAFESHFGDILAAGARGGGGFDLVLGNPPWVRGERLPAQ